MSIKHRMVCLSFWYEWWSIDKLQENVSGSCGYDHSTKTAAKFRCSSRILHWITATQHEETEVVGETEWWLADHEMPRRWLGKANVETMTVSWTLVKAWFGSIYGDEHMHEKLKQISLV